MKTLIKDIREHHFFSFAFAIALCMGIDQLARMMSKPIAKLFGNHIELNLYHQTSIFQFTFVVLAFIAIRFLIDGGFKGAGFRKPENLKYFRLLWISTVVILLSFVVGNLTFNVLLADAFGDRNQGVTFPEQTILHMILSIWIWSSFCEEVLTRGLLQSFVKKHTDIKFLRLSLPVWLSGLYFGGMHWVLFKKMDPNFAAMIMLFTTVTGILAAYYREKTKSIYPAFFIHLWANVLGSLPMIIMKLVG